MPPCTHPTTVPLTRAGAPTGASRCTVCGATVNDDGTVEVNGL